MIALGIALVLFATVLGSFGSLLLKMGSASFSFSIKKIVRNVPLLVGFLCYGISTVPFIISLKFGPLSLLYPFVSLSYVWVTLLAIRFLHEKMNLLKWMGIVLILAGVSLIGAA